MRIVLSAILVSGLSYGVTAPKQPPSPVIEYYSQDDTYDEVLEFEAETGIKIENNIRICIERQCKIFRHWDASDMASEIHLAKTPKTPKGGTGGNTGSGIAPVLKAIGKGISAGGTLKMAAPGRRDTPVDMASMPPMPQAIVASV